MSDTASGRTTSVAGRVMAEKILTKYPNNGIKRHIRSFDKASRKARSLVGSSKRDLLNFPEQVVSDMGYALGLAQLGGKHPDAKPWKGQGSGVFELVERYEGDAYRAVYTVRFETAVYILHAFQKKSPKGIRTDQRDVDLVARRLRLAQEDYEQQVGKGAAR